LGILLEKVVALLRPRRGDLTGGFMLPAVSKQLVFHEPTALIDITFEEIKGSNGVCCVGDRASMGSTRCADARRDDTQERPRSAGRLHDPKFRKVTIWSEVEQV